MPIKLDTPAEQVDVESLQFSPMLQHLQANILKPHGRDFARHIFLRFTGSPAAVRSWIREYVSPRVTSSQQQFQAAAKRRLDPNGALDGGVVCGFFLSAHGYRFLGFDLHGFASEAFQKGMKHRDESVLHKLVDTENEDPRVKDWQAPFREEIHALVTLADDDETTLEDAANKTRQSADTVAEILCIEDGSVLRRQNEPVEHFGYFDGLSQPLFTKQDVDKDRLQNPKTGTWNAAARLSLVLADDPLSNAADAFGSYLVYRKLRQDVPRFDAAVVQLANKLGVAPDLAGAYVVGRFKDGTPVERSQQPAGSASNDFNYDEDKDGVRCPFHAHIRKTNPRGTTPLTSLPAEKRRRIARRGIPYGPPVSGAADNLPPNDDPKTQRGLLFMCFQSSIEDQFEFIQRVWVDNKHFPTSVLTNGLLQADTGDDPLIGQDDDEAQRWPKRWGDTHAGKKTIDFESAVKLEGGEYFFAPSLPFLRSV
jgi:Dyp-type peroxidase family